MKKFAWLTLALLVASMALAGCNIGAQSGNDAASDYEDSKDKAEKLAESGNMPVFDNSP
jgi:predicted small secreted protein